MEHLNQSEAYAELGPTPPSTYTAPHVPPRRPSAKIARLIAELGLRYRPTAQADLEAHAAALALLTSDLSDIPPDILAQAIDEWVRKSRFMPKAAELVEICRELVKPSQDRMARLQAHVERGNAHLREIGRNDVHWFIEDGQIKIGYSA